MNENTIDSLREALKHSPNNTPLRLLLAETLLGLNRLEGMILFGKGCADTALTFPALSVEYTLVAGS